MTRSSLHSSLLITIGVQWAIVLAATLLACFAGSESAWSLFLGGASVVAANTSLAGYLWAMSSVRRVVSIAHFLVGEACKLLATGTALYLSVRALGERMVWPALIVGVLVALKGQWLAVWFSRKA